MKRERLTVEAEFLDPLIRARREANVAGAEGPPRFLVRVDEFPYYSSYDQPDRYGLDAARRFHTVLASAGVPYLMAIVPQLTHRPLDPDQQGGRPLGQSEIEFIEELRGSGVALAQHGTTHRTRRAGPRRHSELSGLGPSEVGALLDRGLSTLAEVGVHPRIFVPPFNRFDAGQWPALAHRFDIVCGGPESVPMVGFHGGPLWHGDAVYLPCYPPLYGTARQILAALELLIARAPGTWIPIVLHLGWEIDDLLRGLEELVARIAPYCVSWSAFLEDVDHSRVP